MGKQLLKEWTAYNDYRRRKLIGDIELFDKSKKDFYRLLSTEGNKRGADLLNSSMRTNWEAKNTPKMEQPTFENFMKWLAEEVGSESKSRAKKGLSRKLAHLAPREIKE